MKTSKKKASNKYVDKETNRDISKNMGSLVVIEEGGAVMYNGPATSDKELTEEYFKMNPELSELNNGISFMSSTLDIKIQPKVQKQRASAKLNTKPVHEIFFKASEHTDDSLWKDILKKMSKNIYRKGFRYYSNQPSGSEHIVTNQEYIDDDLVIGKIVFKIKNKDYECKIVDNPEKVVKSVKEFITSKIGLISDAEQEKLDVILKRISTQPLDTLPKTWGDIKNESVKSILTRHYVDQIKQKHSLSVDKARNLLNIINMGILSGVLESENIEIMNGTIQDIKGVIYDFDTKGYYILLQNTSISPSVPIRNFGNRNANKIIGYILSSLDACLSASNPRRKEIHLYDDFEDTDKEYEEIKFSIINKEFKEGRILTSGIYSYILSICENSLIEKLKEEKNMSNGAPPSHTFHFPTPEETDEFFEKYYDNMIYINFLPIICISIVISYILGTRSSVIISTENDIKDLIDLMKIISKKSFQLIYSEVKARNISLVNICVFQPIKRIIETVYFQMLVGKQNKNLPFSNKSKDFVEKYIDEITSGVFFKELDIENFLSISAGKKNKRAFSLAILSCDKIIKNKSSSNVLKLINDLVSGS